MVLMILIVCFNNGSRDGVYILYLTRSGAPKANSFSFVQYRGFCTCVDVIGDVNNDGYLDILTGDDNNRKSWIWYTGAPGHINTVSSSVIPPGTPSNHYGYSVRAIGDLDKNGVPDFVVGDPGVSVNSITGVGIMWVILLNRDGTVKDSLAVSGSQLGISNPKNSYIGTGFVYVGDINNDGFGDVIVVVSGAQAFYTVMLGYSSSISVASYVPNLTSGILAGQPVEYWSRNGV